MKKFSKALIMFICVLGLITIFCAGCLQDLITPCHIDKNILEYTGEPATSYLPWTTLFDSKRLLNYAKYQKEKIELIYKNALKENSLNYNFCTNTQTIYDESGEYLKNQLFDPKGSIGMALAALFTGLPCALFIKRPGDKSKKELENGGK